MSKGLGRMEKAILAELPSDEMGEPVSRVAWRVARRLGWGIWTLEKHMAMLRKERDEGKRTPEQYAEIASFILNNARYDRHPERLERTFNASFSRALKRLEQKGLADRFQESNFERRGGTLFHVLYKSKGAPRRFKTIRARKKEGGEK